MARRPTDLVKLNLRFPEALRRRLEREAEKSNHSLNSEIVQRLYGSFDSSRDQTEMVARALLRDLDEGVVEKMIELVHRDWADMAAYDEWKERSR
jgi:hypothetical protein